MPVYDDRAGLDPRRGDADLHQHDGGSRDRDRRCRLHHETQGATVRIALIRMEMRHLGHGQQGQQDKTHNRHEGQNTQPLTAFPAELCLESCQKTTPTIKDTQDWTRQHWRRMREGSGLRRGGRRQPRPHQFV